MDDCWLYLKEFEKETDELMSLVREQFWTQIRRNLYKKICKDEGGYNQWAYITGRKLTDSKGQRILLTRKNENLLWHVVNYLNSEEGKIELLEINETISIEHIDDLVQQIQSLRSSEEIKNDEFKMMMKNKRSLLLYLVRKQC